MNTVDDLIGATAGFLAGLPVRERIRACRRIGARVEGIETAAAAELIPDNGDTRAAQRAFADSKRTKHAARRVAKRAAVAAKNSAIAEKMGAEELSGEQVDAIARADSKTDGAASTDEGLIAELAGATADETKGIVDKFIVDQAKADSVEKEYRRQRALREVTRHRTSLGLAALTVAGDDASIDAMYRQLRADEKALFQRDGGRDVPDAQHPRNRGNRLFDAFKARVTGTGDPLDPPTDGTAGHEPGASAADTTADRQEGGSTADATGSRSPQAARSGRGGTGEAPQPPTDTTADQPARSPERGCASGDQSTVGTSDGDFEGKSAEPPPADGSSDPPRLKAVEPSSRYTPPAARRPTVIAVLDLAKLAGTEPSLLAEQIGSGPIPDDILAKYLGDTAVGVDLVGAVFDGPSRPLWLGRSTKDPSLAQYLALVIRDRGCVECGVDPQQCHMHHRIPWNAPAEGETNIENLVLLCSHCHHRLHQQKQTLFRDRTTGRWRKRPATADELPPSQPKKQQKAKDRRQGGSAPPNKRRPKAA